jgi:hypothetical protein
MYELLMEVGLFVEKFIVGSVDPETALVFT